MGFQWPSDPSDNPGTPDDPDVSFLEVAKGCGLTIGLHVVVIVLLCGLALSGWTPALERLAEAFVILFGVTQFVYMGPAIYLARRRGRFGVARGLIIGAAVTFALGAACWAIYGQEAMNSLSGRPIKLD